jgi:hypothetical protein
MWPFYRVADLLVKAVLASPAHFLLSWGLIVLEFTGVKTGRSYRIGVAYRRHGNVLHSMTYRRRQWWRNLQGGREITVIYKGRRISAVTEVEATDLGAIAAGLRDRDLLRRVVYHVPPSDSVLIKIMLPGHDAAFHIERERF